MNQSCFRLVVAVLTFILFLNCNSSGICQDVFRDIDQMRRDIADLKNEVSSLRNIVLELRREIGGAPIATHPRSEVQTTHVDTAAKKPEVSEKELTEIICRAVGEFFVDADRALSLTNGDTASVEMRAALARLDGAVKKYGDLHRVEKLTTIYEGVAWDVAQAVDMKESIVGNQAFINTYNAHKQKYRATCNR